MNDRIYRLVLGLSLLICLYFDLRQALIVIIALELFEGLTNLRIPLLVGRMGAGPAASPALRPARVPFDAERAWRLTVALCLVLSFLIFPEQLWWFAWFMGFAIFGAGLSGVCPMLIILQFIGFR
jgi:hypothetical protein